MTVLERLRYRSQLVLHRPEPVPRRRNRRPGHGDDQIE